MIDVQVVRDTADWVIDIATAIGTVGAVVVAAWSTRNSRRDAREARADALEARVDAKRAREEAERSANDREHRRYRADLTELARERAMRQAAFVKLLPEWGPWEDSAETGRSGVSADQHAPVGGRVVNASSNEIHDVVLQWWHPSPHPELDAVGHPTGERRRPRVGVNVNRLLSLGPRYVSTLEWDGPLPITLEFTDVHLDRWRLSPDGGLRLLNLRDIDIEVD